MWYSPRELEQELRLPDRAVRAWLVKGLPHQRDEHGHIWIDGRQVADWVKALRQNRVRQPLASGEAYCLHCGRPVPLPNPSSTRRGRQTLLRGTCSVCGHTIYRGGRHGQ
jgi:hypothetical protein